MAVCRQGRDVGMQQNISTRNPIPTSHYCSIYTAIGLTPTELINPRRAGLQYLVCVSVSVCLSVCLSVTTFSAATRNETAKKRYHRVQCHTGFILKMAILVKCCVRKLWRKTK